MTGTVLWAATDRFFKPNGAIGIAEWNWVLQMRMNVVVLAWNDGSRLPYGVFFFFFGLLLRIASWVFFGRLVLRFH